MTCNPQASFDHDCQYPSSSTLEYAAADSALAIMARALGNTADADLFEARGQNYRNLFDPSIGFFRPRNANGVWGTPYSPTDGSHTFHEAGAYQYQWLVPQDPDGLVSLLGGKTAANNRLDSFFAYNNLLTDPSGTAHNTWVNGAYDYYSFTTYNPNNEPDLLAPYTYLWTGQPYKTSTVLRAAYTLFTNGPNGVTGNDDLGTMSAWYVFSSLGLYPLMNGANFYGVTTPQFPSAKVTIGTYGSQQGGVLNITAPSVSDSNRYIATASLGGTGFSRDLAVPGRHRARRQPRLHGDEHAGDVGHRRRRHPAVVEPHHATRPADEPGAGQGRDRLHRRAPPTESAAKAVNGSVTGGNTDKFCSTVANPFLQVDLGSTQTVNKFVVKHAGAGGEQAALTPGRSPCSCPPTAPPGPPGRPSPTTPTRVPSTSSRDVGALRADRTSAPRRRRPTRATRIYELEVYGGGHGTGEPRAQPPRHRQHRLRRRPKAPRRRSTAASPAATPTSSAPASPARGCRSTSARTRAISRFEVAARPGRRRARGLQHARLHHPGLHRRHHLDHAVTVSANTAANTTHP